MNRYLSGCFKYVVVPLLLGAALLALLGSGFGYFWASSRLLQSEPLVPESPELGLIRDQILEYDLKPIRRALEERKHERFELKLTDQELSYLVTRNFPPRLGQGRVGFAFAEDKLTFRGSRKWNGNQWLNWEWKGTLAAEAGNFTIRSDALRVGTMTCPLLGLGQLGQVMEKILEVDPSLAGAPWRIPEFKIERNRARLTVETWPEAEPSEAEPPPEK